jgi:uncharacterized membrane protein HdeD (DUF308 family)
MAKEKQTKKSEKKLSGASVAGILVLLGLFLAIWPNTTVTVVLRIVAVVLMAIGCIRGYALLSLGKERKLGQSIELVGAGLLALAGFVLFWIPGFIKNLFPQMMGLLVMIFGVISLLSVLGTRKPGDNKWKIKLILPIVSILCATFVLTHSDMIANTGLRIIGIILIYEGGSQFFIEMEKNKNKKDTLPSELTIE